MQDHQCFLKSGIALRILTLEDNSSNDTVAIWWWVDMCSKIAPFCRCWFILVIISFRVCPIYEALGSAQSPRGHFIQNMYEYKKVFRDTENYKKSASSWNVTLIYIIIMKKGRQCKAEREWYIHPISPKTPAPQYQPIDRKKIKGKIVEDYSMDRAA